MRELATSHFIHVMSTSPLPFFIEGIVIVSGSTGGLLGHLAWTINDIEL